jgi:HlyD family secretion protein
MSHSEGASEPSTPLGAVRSAVSALGRLEPKDGLIQVAGPSVESAVVGQLLVDRGDRVEKGQVIAVLDTVEILEARIARTGAELRNAEAEFERHRELHEGKVIPDSVRDTREMGLHVARAEHDQALADLKLAKVRSPISGRVIEVHAREGERVGPDGIMELGRVDEMYAIAEVYETDIPRVRLGQRAIVTSPALDAPLSGAVDWISLTVGRLEDLDTEPSARTDARIVEVEVRLDDSSTAGRFTNLQVEVEFQP